jgi:hypothetical protein
MNKYLSRLVKHTLVSNEDCRDDLTLTIKSVHDKEMQIWCYDKSEYYDAFFGGNLSSVHTIRRIWQLVQEKFPELRGKEWEERQKQAGMIAQEIAEEKYAQLELFKDK